MKRNILTNSFWLLLFQFFKIIFPIITLPYLTRIMTTEAYGVVSYTKTIMTYMQLFVDFGFMLSGTKDIIKALGKKNKVQKAFEETYTARLILGIMGFGLVLAISLVLPLARANILFVFLSYVAVFLTIFLFDFYFRGIEKMHIITIRFAIMKILSTLALFTFVKSDKDMLLIPLLDILAAAIAIIFVSKELKKDEIKLHISNIKKAFAKIKDSFVYFLSNAASNSLSALTTIIIGIFLTSTDVAYWGLAMQIIGTIQSCYSPISDAIYPEMIKTKSLKLIKRILLIMTPIILAGTAIVFLLSPLVITILGGEDYAPAIQILQITTPCLFFGFLAIILGWPALGSINKQKQTTITTVFSLLVNILTIILLATTDHLTLITLAFARILGDLSLFISRLFFVYKYRNDFNKRELQ